MNLEQHAMQDDEVTCFTSPFISNIDGVRIKSTSYAEVEQGDGLVREMDGKGIGFDNGYSILWL